jgi:hypothetical protein
MTTNGTQIEILTATPNGNVVEYGPDDDAETVEREIGDEWRVDWDTAAVRTGGGRMRSPIFRQATLVFGCSDESLGYEAWQIVFADLAAHLKATVGEDLYGNDWFEADEGCSITADAGRIEKIEAAIASFVGPVYVIAPVAADAVIVLNEEGYPVLDAAVRS